ncbi:tail completion or Neck1 protein [Arthrobacter phage TripleJ]|uniref:Minor capsid protein n=1 Tax=Arthrobacter phage TripleJ TaxID=2599838 RepID=A0A5J6THP1_9CAUD|nr:tail completion or Neck1 protein [Arthrobacter phage TripleJ]QFG09554.1 minor capsid protein [Arthrobacter phage TripleJ]
MAGVDFDVSDINRLSGSLAQAAVNIGRGAQVVVRKAAIDTERDAKNFAPVDTGNLKSSIGHSDLRNVGQSGSLEAEVGPTANYGHYVEFGTSRMAPRAFLGPALDRNAPAFAQALEQLAERTANGGT